MKLHLKQPQFSGSYYRAMCWGDGIKCWKELNCKQTEGLDATWKYSVKRPAPNAALGYRNRVLTARDALPVLLLGQYVSWHWMCMYMVLCSITNPVGKTHGTSGMIQSPLKSRALSIDLKGLWICTAGTESQAHCWNKWWQHHGSQCNSVCLCQQWIWPINFVLQGSEAA